MDHQLLGYSVDMFFFNVFSPRQNGTTMLILLYSYQTMERFDQLSMVIQFVNQCLGRRVLKMPKESLRLNILNTVDPFIFIGNFMGEMGLHG